MKDATEWTVDDLNELITDQAEESISLEFKHGQVLEDLRNRLSADKRKEEISTDVSAFANRIGGVIVYGLEEAKQEPHQAKALTPIDPTKCSKERLEQIITSRIRPRIQVVINPISLGPGKVIYVVKIPRSHTAHQASDKRYYRRVNFGNEVMEDDEIRLIMNRQSKPTYHVQLRAGLIDPDELAITGNIHNTSVMIGRDVSALLLLPNELSRHPTTNGGSELIQNQAFVRILNDFRAHVKSELKPFEKMEISFGRAVKLPEVPPSFRVPLFVRVYDQFGQAHEAEFIVSLHPDSLGQIVRDQQQSRDEGF